MAEHLGAADDELEKLLDFDDLEIPTVFFKSSKTLPSVETKEAGTKTAAEPPCLNSSGHHVSSNAETVHAHANLDLDATRVVDADDSDSVASTRGTFVIASRVDRFTASADSVRPKTFHLDTQIVLSGPNGLDNDSVKDLNGGSTGQGLEDTQRIQSASCRGWPDVIEECQKREDFLPADHSTDVQAHVGDDENRFAGLDEMEIGRGAEHALKERSFQQSTDIRGRQKRCSILQVDKAEAEVEIVPQASIGRGEDGSGGCRDEILWSRPSTVHGETQGAGRLGSYFRGSGITAPVQKVLNLSKNAGNAVENTQLLSSRDFPVQSQCHPQKGERGSCDERTGQQDVGLPERESNVGLPYRIPGPAGAFQENFRNRTSSGSRITRPSSLEPVSQSDTSDFNEGPWITAMDYMRVGGQHPPRDTIATIKSISRHLEHIPKLVTVIKTVLPNGFGDISVVLKDPTGTMNGYIHRGVLTESKHGDGLVPGAVLILKKVAVFCPNPYAHYLNITLENVDKVFGSEVGCSRPQARVSRDKTNVEGNKFRFLAVSSNDPKELPTDLADSPRMVELTGGRQNYRRQQAARHDASHFNTNISNQTRLRDTEDTHSRGKDVHLGIRGKSMTRPFQDPNLDTRKREDDNEKFTKEAVVAAKAKAAGWDFGEDVELLLNDDLDSFLV